jgi:hypothetical protein
LLGALVGIAAGILLGRRWFGSTGMILLGLTGLFVGFYTGRLPYLIALQALMRNIQRSDAATLRLRLDKEYYISHLIIAELLLRGENIDSFRHHISGLVNSDSAKRRRFGREILRIWPDAAQPLDSSDPQK